MAFSARKQFCALVVCAGISCILLGCKPKEAGFTETRVSLKTSLPADSNPSQAKSLTFAEFISIPEPPGVLKNDPRYEKQRIPSFPNSLGVKEGDVVKVK